MLGASRIYKYFLTQFTDLAAHDNGEFFTPMSLVQMFVNVIDPDHGTIVDPACGSGGRLVITSSASVSADISGEPGIQLSIGS